MKEIRFKRMVKEQIKNICFTLKIKRHRFKNIESDINYKYINNEEGC
jgi:hypothetical protein